MLGSYLKSLYQDAMSRAYDSAYAAITRSIDSNSSILDCGANDGNAYDVLASRSPLSKRQYSGIEWDHLSVSAGNAKELNISQGDLNNHLPYPDESFSCVYALSVLEHLLRPCRFLRECHRVLRPGGQLVLLTPNISTYFTAALILAGRMPSSGPHPDSDELILSEELFKVSDKSLLPDTESDTPVHRHLVVFSYSVLRRYLYTLGFGTVQGRGFGLYPIPRSLQPAFERLDPQHCHQMVFVATKPA